MSMRYHEDKNRFLSGFCENIHQFQDYLIAEVLALEDPSVSDCLCKLSILDRFCASICGTVCRNGPHEPDEVTGGDIFHELIHRSGVFVIALDGQRRWFRFHHFFQDLLKSQLVKKYNPEAISELHTRAAQWLEANGYLEEAVRHFVMSGDQQNMCAFILRNRRQLFQNEEWLRIDALLSKIPPTIANLDPELVMIKVWMAGGPFSIAIPITLAHWSSRWKTAIAWGPKFPPPSWVSMLGTMGLPVHC